ncbi:putative glucose/galactose transporter [Fusarium oxysporum f. sp. albedinis]|nr:putative glucose/galactose transporter [Fusarium oxysporum f. sp. albedinis]
MLSLPSTPTISTLPNKSNRDSLLCAVYGGLIPETTKQRQYMLSWVSMGYEIGLARVSSITPRPMIHVWRASIVNFILQWRKDIFEIIELDALGKFLTLQLEPFSGEKILTRLTEKPSRRPLSKLKSVSFGSGGNGERVSFESDSTLTISLHISKRRRQSPDSGCPVQDELSRQDWLLLAEIQSLLKPLYETTMRCQGWAKEGRHGALWEVMIGMEYLAIPAMSVDPERTFSVTKLTVSSQRHSISPEIIEEMQCLRNWLRHQAITMGEVVSFGGDLVRWEGGEA